MTSAVLKAEPRIDQPQTGISANAGIATALNGVLADSVVLMLKTQSCHWNVVGPLFQPIHELTEGQYRDLFEAIDTLAERIRALGEFAPVSFTDMLAHAELSEEERLRPASGMLAQLIDDHESLARRLRNVAALAGEHGDGATEDLANARMAFHEKAAWMLRAIASE